jgi:hypothetical protein
MAFGDEGIKPFANFIAEACDGDINNEASVELKALIEAVSDAVARDGGSPKGSINVKINLKHDGKSLGVTYEITTKKPPRKRSGGVVWVTKEGNFTLKNPRQQELPGFRDVSRPAEVAKDDAQAPRMAEGT